MPRLTRTFTTTVDIAAPPAQVWAVMSDLARWPEWTASMTSVTPLGQGPLAAGRTVRVKQPKLAAATFVITDWRPERGFDWITRSAAVTAVARHDIEPTPDGSRVTLAVEFSGPLARLVCWLYGRLTERYIRMEARGLKAAAEAARAPRQMSP